MDYVNTNPSSIYNPASYNSRNFQVAEPHMGGLATLFVAAGDKVKEHGMYINQYKTTITINDPTISYHQLLSSSLQSLSKQDMYLRVDES